MLTEQENLNTEETQEQEQTTSAPEETEPKRKKGKKEKAPDLEQRLAAAEEQASAAAEKAKGAEDRLLRTAAEFENYRKRTQKELEGAFNNGVSHAALELLPVIDTLEVAANAESTDEEYKKGVLMILAKCEEVFKKLGITEIEALNQPFDPELHNAVMQEAAEGCECGTVTRVMQKGYKLGDRVVRHCMVAVAP